MKKEIIPIKDFINLLNKKKKGFLISSILQRIKSRLMKRLCLFAMMNTTHQTK